VIVCVFVCYVCGCVFLPALEFVSGYLTNKLTDSDVNFRCMLQLAAYPEPPLASRVTPIFPKKLGWG